MSFLPIIRATKLIPILLRMGFRIIRQRGSHVSLEHILDKTKKVTVPMHNKDLAKKTLLLILKQAGISIQEFLRLLGK
jgi:predicted RNA binding protein YcfA (HicA-like mRNA interferase family)